MKRYRALALGSPLVLSLALLAFHQACSSDDSNGGSGRNDAGVGASSANGGAGAKGAGGSGAGGDGTGTDRGGGPDAGNYDGNFSYDAPEFDGAFNQDAACAGDSLEASPLPLDIFIMLDKTGSMGNDCDVTYPAPPTQTSKWCYAVNAIAGYLNDPGSQGNRLAIQFFSGDGGGMCTGSGLDVAAAGLVDLTAQANVIVAAMNGQTPGGLTPTEGALNGIATYTTANQTAGRIMIGILITDGDPTSCNQSDASLAAIAANHFAATGIHTFMIGMNGATFSRLETWASYPGAVSHDDTNDACGPGIAVPCHSYNVGGGDPTVFVAALKQIQNAVIGCTFTLPQPTDGGVLDPNQVVVEYQAGGNPPGQPLTKVADASQCTPDGWYYDDNVNPTTINLCTAICGTVTMDPMAKVNILLGCQGS